MSETLASRVGRLISGGMNAMIDAIESRAPDAMLQETIREIDEAIDDVRAELGRCLASKHMSSQRLAQLNTRHNELVEQIETAVAESKDDLARAGIAAQLDIEVQLPVLEKAIADEATRERDLEGYINALQAKKRQMADEAQQLRELRGTSAAQGGAAGKAAAPIEHRVGAKVDKAVGAFDRVAATQARLPGAGGVNLKDAQKISELETLNRNNRITERLTALKAQPRR